MQKKIILEKWEAQELSDILKKFCSYYDYIEFGINDDDSKMSMSVETFIKSVLNHFEIK